MTALDMLEIVRKRPFEPFRIRLDNNQEYEVRHPEMAMIGLTSMVIGLVSREIDEPVYERWVTVSLEHIAEIEPLQPTAQA